MERHVRIIGLLYVFLGAFLVLLGVAVLFMFGGAALSGSDHEHGSVVVPVIGAVGGIVFLILSLVSIPALVAGVGLLRHRAWARIVTILLSGVVMLAPILLRLGVFVPLGTFLGFYSLWVLLSKKTEPLFARQGDI